jgi:hypothetical protein
MKAKDFDKKFDDGEDISELLDISRARRLVLAEDAEDLAAFEDRAHEPMRGC